MLVRKFVPSDLETLVSMYIGSFSEPPWYEVITREEAEKTFSGAMAYEESVILTGTDDDGNRPIGSAIMFAVSRRHDVVSLLSGEDREAAYLAEVFVHSDHRHSGVASRLIGEMMINAAAMGFRRFAVRTSVDQPIIRRIFGRLGFSEVAVDSVESMKLVGGAIRSVPDRRVIMCGDT
ncbi:GNAT family N-acetyltransferase [Candidatus Uhrbacteria bacterium]|nr:GNAT family N-acetyltransferase [Candidatus Uhrbacteria bacterium]